ncbi:MAG TPA: hypothetical protein VEA60_12085, partial [Allosphingosinicella sp.]|nr:hypothetical protein [Allosphingosinicella sp.]
MKRWAAAAALLALLMTALWFKGRLIAPAEVPAQAAPGGFDTARAMARLGRVLGGQRPHPVDGAEADAVRGRLLAELRSLGLAPVVTDALACNGTGKSRAV